jgi:hypothetical protein
MSGDPNRTSFELQLNSNMAIWLAGAASPDGKRTVGGRLTDAQAIPSIVTRSGSRIPTIVGKHLLVRLTVSPRNFSTGAR